MFLEAFGDELLKLAQEPEKDIGTAAQQATTGMVGAVPAGPAGVAARTATFTMRPATAKLKSEWKKVKPKTEPAKPATPEKPIVAQGEGPLPPDLARWSEDVNQWRRREQENKRKRDYELARGNKVWPKSWNPTPAPKPPPGRFGTPKPKPVKRKPDPSYGTHPDYSDLGGMSYPLPVRGQTAEGKKSVEKYGPYDPRTHPSYVRPKRPLFSTQTLDRGGSAGWFEQERKLNPWMGSMEIAQKLQAGKDLSPEEKKSYDQWVKHYGLRRGGQPTFAEGEGDIESYMRFQNALKNRRWKNINVRIHEKRKQNIELTPEEKAHADIAKDPKKLMRAQWEIIRYNQRMADKVRRGMGRAREYARTGREEETESPTSREALKRKYVKGYR